MLLFCHQARSTSTSASPSASSSSASSRASTVSSRARNQPDPASLSGRFRSGIDLNARSSPSTSANSTTASATGGSHRRWTTDADGSSPSAKARSKGHGSFGKMRHTTDQASPKYAKVANHPTCCMCLSLSCTQAMHMPHKCRHIEFWQQRKQSVWDAGTSSTAELRSLLYVCIGQVSVSALAVSQLCMIPQSTHRCHVGAAVTLAIHNIAELLQGWWVGLKAQHQFGSPGCTPETSPTGPTPQIHSYQQQR